MPPAKLRLDQLLVARGYFESREKAQRAIMAGGVSIGEQRVDKAGTRVAEDADIHVKTSDRYVGRGGLKMEAALREFAVDPTGATCLDIGASTGGFTDCLLQHGAAKVYAIDVGHSQLDWKIRRDPRVVVREKLNARHLTRTDIPDPIAICVIDVSFISLTLILPPAASLLSNGGVIIPLIKPQFELRKEDVGKGGVVRDPALHQQAVEKIRAFVENQPGLAWSGLIESPILGGEGNKEFLGMSPRRIGLIANDGKAGAGELVHEIIAACESRSLPLIVEAGTAAALGTPSRATHRDLVRDCDLLLVLGGDGTILRVLHELCDEFRPIFGINLGTLGFLTCVGASAWPQAIEAIAAGTYCVSERTLLDVEVLRDGQRLGRYIALNDAVISRGELSRLIKLNVTVDSDRLSEYNADGLIVATPTGSTAYSLSAGGPVLAPDSGVFIVTPICPHVLTMRPVLVSDTSCIEITPSLHQPEIFLTLDGENAAPILAGDVIRITKGPQRLPLAMLPGMSFFEVLRHKLKWSGTAI